jgi:hypothetical protein
MAKFITYCHDLGVTSDDVWIGFVDHLQAVTTNNYSTIADTLYKSLHAKSSPACNDFTVVAW